MRTAEPGNHARRSFVYRRLIEHGAIFTEVADSAVADHFPGQGGLPSRLSVVDLSPLPRRGFKGCEVMPWLTSRGVAVPAVNNHARTLDDGSLVARLADTEALLLCNPLAPRMPTLPDPEPGTPCYFVPRRDSHFWFILTGRLAEPCLRKLCGVDLRPERFPDLAVAQTSVARLSTILIRQDRCGTSAFHLLADSASSLYLWDVLIDAMREFNGAPGGLRALRALDRARRPTA